MPNFEGNRDPSRGNFPTVPVHTEVTVGIAQSLLVAANEARNYLMIQNSHASQNLFIKLGGTLTGVDQGIKLQPGEMYEISVANGNLWLGLVNGYASAAGTIALILEA